MINNNIYNQLYGDKEPGKKRAPIEPMNFRILVGCSTTEPQELKW